LLLFGGALLVLAWLLLAEYRRVFLANPRSVMSFEVLAEIVGGGGPGYLAVASLCVGGVLFGIGALLLLYLIGEYVFLVARALFPAT